MKQLKKINRLSMSVFFVVLTLIQFSFAQMDQYTRKSISMIDMLVYTARSEHLDLETEQRFLTKMQNQIRLERFDINQLPSEIGNKLRNSIPSSPDLEETDILIQAMESVILPEIQKILDIEKEIRAQGMVSETDRNSYIALKAKEIGVSSEHMIDVMNSAYIFLPYASSIKSKKHKKDSEKKDDKNKMNVTVNGGLYIYKINYAGDFSISKMGQINSSAYASEEKGKGSWEAARDKAIISTANSLGSNLKLELQKLEDFKLKAQLRKVKGLHVQFPLGKREGLKLDRPYFVGEWVENKKGVRKFEKDGFVRIGKVANNNNDPAALSTAYIIKKGNWARGMTLVEHPTLGVDFVMKPRMFIVEIDSGYFHADKEDPGVYIASAEKDQFGFDFDLNINIAEQTKKLQSFMVLGGTISFMGIENKIFDKDDFPMRNINNNLDNSAAFFFNGYLGYMRKHYVGPIAIHHEFLFGIQGISFSNEFEDENENLSISAYGFGGRANLGLEYALNVNWNIGVFAGYDYYPGLSIWRMKYSDWDEEDDDDEYFNLEKYNGTDYPKFKNVGPTFGIYLHYSIPSMGSSTSKVVDLVSANLMN